MPEDPPLPAVSVAGENEVNSGRNVWIILRVMAEQDVIAGSGVEVAYPIRLRFMLPGMNRTAHASNILTARIPWLCGLCGSESAVIGDIAGGQATDHDLLVVHGDGLVAVI